MKGLKTAGTALITAGLMLSAGCAQKADWIESTLVTVDVTGVWEGTAAGGAGNDRLPATRALLELEQEGPKVKGKLQIASSGGAGRNSGFLEGRVGGDVFHFTVTSSQGDAMPGEMTVSGDEMEGTFTVHGSTGRYTVRSSLRRVAPPSRLQSN